MSACSSSSNWVWNTGLTKLIPSCKIPIIGAPMAGVSGGKLAAETCRAGAIGFIAAGHFNSKNAFQQLEKEIQIFRDMTKTTTTSLYPLAIGFIGHSTFGGTDDTATSNKSIGRELFEQLLKQYTPDIIQIFAPAIDKEHGQHIVQLAHQHNAKVIAQVGSIQEGMDAINAGVDCLIAQGNEAGGHGLRRELGNGTLPLTLRLIQLCHSNNNNNNNNNNTKRKKIPVIAAGGITTGHGLASMLALGADGIVLGTRLWASEEGLGLDKYKQQLVETKTPDDIIRTQAFDTIWNSYRPIKWPKPYDSCGAIRNSTTEAWDTKQTELEQALYNNSSSIQDTVKAYQQADQIDNDYTIAPILCGQGVGEINKIEPTFDIIRNIEHDAINILTKQIPTILQQKQEQDSQEKE